MPREKVYICMKLQGWDCLSFSVTGFPTMPLPEMKGDDLPGCGFMVVFKTREEAEAWGGPDDIVEAYVFRKEGTANDENNLGQTEGPTGGA